MIQPAAIKSWSIFPRARSSGVMGMGTSDYKDELRTVKRETPSLRQTFFLRPLMDNDRATTGILRVKSVRFGELGCRIRRSKGLLRSVEVLLRSDSDKTGQIVTKQSEGGQLLEEGQQYL